MSDESDDMVVVARHSESEGTSETSEVTNASEISMEVIGHVINGTETVQEGSNYEREDITQVN